LLTVKDVRLDRFVGWRGGGAATRRRPALRRLELGPLDRQHHRRDVRYDDRLARLEAGGGIEALKQLRSGVETLAQRLEQRPIGQRAHLGHLDQVVGKLGFVGTRNILRRDRVLRRRVGWRGRSAAVRGERRHRLVGVLPWPPVERPRGEAGPIEHDLLGEHVHRRGRGRARRGRFLPRSRGPVLRARLRRRCGEE